MSEFPYDADGADDQAVQDNEIESTATFLRATDARAHDDRTYHQGADYGLPTTTVTIADGAQCNWQGVMYYGGETLRVPKWCRSSWFDQVGGTGQ